MKNKIVDPNADFNEKVMGVDTKIEQEIKVEMYNKGGKSKIKVDPKRMNPTDQSDAKNVGGKIKIKKVITLFKMKDPGGNLKTNFPTPLEIQIEYTDKAWKEALKDKKAKKKDRPRLAYLIWDDKKTPKWTGDWVEFDNSNISVIVKPDPNGDPNGYIILSLNNLPDPAIGGC